MSTVPYRLDRELTVVKEADVIVVGGGPGGLGAAVMAARAGARTVLIEKYGMLGGMGSVGEVHPFMMNHHENICMDKPVYAEWVHGICSYLPAHLRDQAWADPEATGHLARSLGKEAAALAAEDLCLEAGVDLLYHHALADVVVNERRIDYLVLNSKSGLVAARARSYVDCTGDGDLAAWAGCEFELGNDQGGCQPMTLCFKLSGVNGADMSQWDTQWRRRINELYHEAQQTGEISCPRQNVLMFKYYDDDTIHFNTTRVCGKLGCDGLALSEAEIIARQQLREYLTFLRGKVPGFENAMIHSMGAQIGVRETRRIKGINTIRRECFTHRTKFDDAICRCNYSIDIHSPTGSGTELEHMPRSEYFEVPYGCIVTKDIDNLTVGGRPISADVAIHSSVRVMPSACTIGQAAGLAAAMSGQAGKSPAELDGVDVRRKLRAMGAYL
jgi:hypothetical protein